MAAFAWPSEALRTAVRPAERPAGNVARDARADEEGVVAQHQGLERSDLESHRLTWSVAHPISYVAATSSRERLATPEMLCRRARECRDIAKVVGDATAPSVEVVWLTIRTCVLVSPTRWTRMRQ